MIYTTMCIYIQNYMYNYIYIYLCTYIEVYQLRLRAAFFIKHAPTPIFPMHAKKWAAFVLWVDLKTWYPFHPLVNHHFQPFSHMFAMNAIQWGSIPHFQIITPNHLFPFLISHDICPVFVHVASHLYRDFTVLALKKNTKNTR